MEEQKTLALAKLREYPFRLLPGERVTVWAGYADVRDKLLRIVETPRTDRVGLYEFAILWGELGTGKSHALRYLKYQIAEEFRDEFQSPVVYLDTLKLEAKTTFMSIFRATMASLEDRFVEVGRALDATVNRIVTEEWKEQQSQSSLFTEPEFREKRRKQILEGLCHGFPALPRLLIATKDGDQRALSILKGNKHKPEELRPFGLTNSIENDYDAVRCFGQFVNLTTNPVVSGASPIFKAVYLFLDELEIIQDFKPEQIMSINQGIRDLLNACPEHFCLLCGFTGSIEALEGFLESAVMARLTAVPLEVPPLETNQAVEFLTQVLAFYRLDDSDPREYPFTKETLGEIVAKTTTKTPRNLFKNARVVLERSVLDGKLVPGGTIAIELVDAYLD